MTQKRSVLIVEDSDTCVTLLKIALEQIRDLSICAVPDLLHARLWLNSNCKVSLVVTDLNFPDGHGFELLEYLRQNARLRTVPVVVVSGDTCLDVAQICIQRGVCAFFTKPFSPAQICTKVEELLQFS